MRNLRELLNRRPWIGWAVAAVFVLLSAYLFLRSRSGSDPYSLDRLTEEVTIRFTDTNDEITLPRGRMERELRYRPGQLDPTQGIINPQTGQATGFLFDKREWEATIKRLNAEKEQAAAQRGRKPDAKGGSTPPRDK